MNVHCWLPDTILFQSHISSPFPPFRVLVRLISSLEKTKQAKIKNISVAPTDVYSIRNINKTTLAMTGIASQTNLLALNTKNEAARVGAFSRVFSVVSSEMMMLTETIKYGIKNIEQVTSEAIKSIKNKIRV